MYKEAKYSVLLYYSNITNENKDDIIYYLKKGIVVHLFLKKELDKEIRKVKIIKEALEFNLLYQYVSEYELQDGTIVVSDNEGIGGDIYNELLINNSEFNNEQYEIITAKEKGNYMIISGAGTGKTTTMINRIIYLIKTSSSFKFEKTVLITFTNKASIEMREKLLDTLQRYYKVTGDGWYLELMEESSRAVISTIHSFAKKLIDEFGKNININKNVEVKSFKFKRKEAITKALNFVFKEHRDLYDIIKKYPIYEVERIFIKLWDKIDNYSVDINSKISRLSFGEDTTRFNELMEVVLRKAQEILDSSKEDEIEIADLMKKLSYKELLYGAKGKYDLIMIDEFQDSDNIQIEFVVDFLNITGANLFVVGDTKQSIYRFRGAEYTSFDILKESMKGRGILLEKPFNMNRNYRTNSKLLKEINELFIGISKIVDNFDYKKEEYIYSEINKDVESKIEYVSLKDNDEKTVEFYNNILEDKGKSIAVLFRSNADLKEFKNYCDRNAIFCRVDVSGEFYRHEAVRDFYIMIKALINDDNQTKYAFINTPYIIGSVNKEIIVSGEGEEISEHLNSLIQKNRWNKYTSKLRSINILHLIDEIIEEVNPVKNYYVSEYFRAKKLKKLSPERYAKYRAYEYKINLEHLLYLIRDNFIDDVSSIFSVENFLKLKIATDNSIDTRKVAKIEDSNFLQCMTIHKAKGLEFDYVIMPKLTNPFIRKRDVELRVYERGYIGYKVYIEEDEYKNSNYSKEKEDKEKIGEETRLLYVAMTRCKEKLFLNAAGIIASEGQNNWKNLIGGTKRYV